VRAEPEPKPFLYVHIPHTHPVKKRAPNHDRFEANTLTGKLTLQFEVMSEYLFVGSGGYDYRDDMVFYSFASSHDELVIPGTSIKGAVRSLVEAISSSCVSIRIREERVPRPWQQCVEVKMLCPACRLFGIAGRESYSGRVSFTDGEVQTFVGLELVKVGELHRPKPGRGDARKFYAERRFTPPSDMRPERDYRFVEAVKQGSVFVTTLKFGNLAPEELSLLLHALGIPQPHAVKIGGVKPRGFGSVRFAATRLTALHDPFSEPERKEGNEVDQFIEEVCRATDLVQPDLLQTYQQQMAGEADQPAPRRLY